MKFVHRLIAVGAFSLLGLASASPALAQATWTGGTPATWSTTSFWTTGTVPTASTAVVFTPSANATMNVTNGVIATATSIDFANTAGTTTLSINNGGRLTVGGAITDTGAGTAAISVSNTSSANAASILSASSIALDTLNLTTSGTQFLTMNADITLQTQLNIGNASGTATYRQTGGTLTINSSNYGLTLVESQNANPTGTASFILDGGRVMASRIGVANGNGKNDTTTRYAANGSFVFNSGTVQANSANTYFQNGSARTSSTTTDTQLDTSKPVTISLAAAGTHEFNATGGNIFISPSAQVRDQAGVAGTLLKTGTGSLILTGNGPVAINDWTGASTVNAGTLSVDYNQIAGTATSSGTTALSNAYSPASQLVLNGGNFTLTGRPNASASSQTGRSLNAGSYNLTVTSTAGLVVGQAVTNANLPAGTYIRRITNATTVELNAMITGTTNVSGQQFDFAAANFTNSQTINSVSLQQSGTVTVNPAGDGTVLTFGTVSGAAGFTKAGTGLLVLSGSNTFSGGATLSAGTLALNNASALGTGTFTISGGVIDNTTAGAIALTQANPQAWNADFTFAGTQNLDLGAGDVTLSANRQVTTSAGVLTVGGAIGGGAVNLTKAGAGMLRLTGVNTYSGTTAISAGTLQLGGGGAAGAIGGGAVTVASGGLLSFNRTDNYGGSFANVISGSGNVELLSGTLAFTGANTYTGTTTITAGQLSIGSGTNAGSIAGPIANGAALVFNRSDALSYAGVISGAGTVTKSGAGTLTLSGSSTYTGKTTIAGGGISINSIGNVNGGASALGNPDSVANGTIDLAGTLTYTGTGAATDRRLNVGNGAVNGVIVNSGAGRLTLDGALVVNAYNAWSLNPTGSGSEILVNGLVSGNGGNGLYVNSNGNPGTVTLTNAANSFSGGLNLNQGTVSIASIANSGSNSPIGAGSSIGFGNSNYNMTGRLLFTGSAGGSSNRSIAIYGGTAGTGFTNGGILENAVAGQTLALSGNVTATGATPSLQVVGAGDGVLSGTISDGAGDLSITKSGAGTWTLSGSNSYSGATAVSQGTLAFSTVNALRNTSGVSITGGAALRYSGGAATFDRNVSVTSGTGTVSNSGGGLLTLSGTLTKDGTVLRLTGGSFNVTGQIVGSSSNSDLLVDGTSTVTLSSANTYNGPTFVNQASNLIVGVANAIPSNSIVTLGKATTTGTLTLGSNSNAIGGLAFGAGGGTLRMAASATGATAQLTATSGTLTLTGGSLDLTGSGTSAGYYRLLSAQSIGGSFSSITGTSGAYQVLTTSTSIDYQQRAVLGAVTVTNPAVSIITGGSAAFTYSVANNALSGGASLAVTGTGLSNVIGTSGGSAAAAGTSGAISGLFFNGTTVGSSQQGTFTVSAPTAYGATTATGTVSVNVLDHSNAALALASGGGQKIITGGSFASVGFNLTNAGSNRAAVQVNSLTNLTGGTGSSVVLSGGTASYTASIADALTIGTGTVSVGMLAGDQQSLSGASSLQSLTSSATYTVLDHATSSLAGSLLTSTTISLGTWNYATNSWETGGDTGFFLIYNLASSFGANNTADLSLLSVTGTANGFTTNLATYANIAGGTSSQFSIFFDPAGLTSSMTKSTTFEIAMRDDPSLSGATNTNTLSVTASVIVVPEPGAIWLVGIGAGLGGVVTWSRRRASAARR